MMILHFKSWYYVSVLLDLVICENNSQSLLRVLLFLAAQLTTVSLEIATI